MELITYRSQHKRYQDGLKLRNKILRQPSGKDLLTEDLSLEQSNQFYGCLVGQQLVGTLSIYEEASQVARLTGFAIDTNYQHRGYGQQLVRYVLADLAQQDY